MPATRFLRTALVFLVASAASLAHVTFDESTQVLPSLVPLYVAGWMSLALAAVLYASFPYLQRGWAPRMHYLLHTSGLAVLGIGLAMGALQVDTSLNALAWAGLGMVVAGLGIFTLNAIASQHFPKDC